MRFYLTGLCNGILGISIVLATSSCNDKGGYTDVAVKDQRTHFCNFTLNHSAEAVTTDTINVRQVDTQRMVLFINGKIRFGSYAGNEIEKPLFEKEIKSFLLDQDPVSVSKFRAFVNATGYKTEAEVFGQSLVYTPYLGDFTLVKGASWEFPLGKNGGKAEDNHPVTHITYNDALSYAKWLGKRLPTEFEYEYATKGGQNVASRFPWGDEASVLGHYKGNFSQAEAATDSTSKDNYFYTSPIGTFGSSAGFLNDAMGNVWEWTSSVLDSYPGATFSTRAGPGEHVLRGGSYLINPKKNNEFGLWTRLSLGDQISRGDVGFRCASTIK